MTQEEMILPNYDEILAEAHKFKSYGNSWTEKGKDFWDKRLEREVQEFKDAQSPAEARHKAANILNIAAMAYNQLQKEPGIIRPI
jgi:hypothetical protein